MEFPILEPAELQSLVLPSYLRSAQWDTLTYVYILLPEVGNWPLHRLWFKVSFCNALAALLIEQVYEHIHCDS
jgi:hypothetical protein